MNNRILELALEALEMRKKSVDTEIEEIRRQLAPGRAASASVAAGGNRKRSAAERKAQSRRMKAVWAARRAAKAK